MNYDQRYCEICGSHINPFCSYVSRCSGCGLFISNSVPGYGNPVKGMDKISNINFSIIKNLLERLIQIDKASILDVGCADGTFSKIMYECGADVVAIEPDSSTAEKGISSGFPIDIVDFDTFVLNSTQKFDVIVFNDVFEHMSSPDSIIKKSKERLKSKGLLVFNLPVSNGLVFKVCAFLAKLGFIGPFDRIWARNLSSPHINFYSRNNIHRLLLNNQFKVVSQGRLVAISVDGMYSRLRTTFGPIQSVVLASMAFVYMFISYIFGPDVMFFVGESDE